MIWRIGEMLGLETQRTILLIRGSLLPVNRAVQMIRRIHLHSWFGRQYGEHSARFRIIGFRSLRQLFYAFIDHEVVVIALAAVKLLVIRIDVVADGVRFQKIKW